MNLTRQYKLWKLDIPIDSKYIEIFKYLESKLFNLQIYEMADKPEWIFFMNSENVNVLQFNKQDLSLYTNYDNVWSDLEKKYSVKMDETVFHDMRSLLGNMVSGEYDLKINETARGMIVRLPAIEKSYRLTTKSR